MLQRIKYLDIAKGIGIILVVLVHSSCIPEFYIKYINAFYMPMFYIISGFFYKYNNIDDLKNNLKKMIRNYFIYCLILFVVVYLIKLFSFSLTIGDIKTSLISILYGRFIDSNNSLIIDNFHAGHLWFYTGLITGKILVFPILNSDKKYRPIFIIAYIVISYFFDKTSILFPWCFDIAPIIAIYIYVGNVLSNYFDKINIKTIFLCLVLYLLTINNYDIHIRKYGDIENIYSILSMILCGIAGSIIVLKLSYIISNINKNSIIEYVGKNSMYVYIYHIMFISITNAINSYIYIYMKDIDIIIIKFIEFISIILMSLFFGKIISKIEKEVLKYHAK